MPLLEPEIRAALTQSLLLALRGLPSGERERILCTIHPHDIEDVRAALAIGWLPMSLHMRISDAIRDAVGPQRNVEVWHETMRDAFGRPLLKSFVALTLGIFGVTPRALLKRAEKVHELMTRGCGNLSYVDQGEREGTLTLRGFPADRYRFICYVEGLAGCLEAAVELGRMPGTVQVADLDPEGSVRYRIRWG